MKKAWHISDQFIRELNNNRRAYLITAGIFLLGILAGSIIAASGNDNTELKEYFDHFLSGYPLQGAAHSEIFQLSLTNYLRMAVLLWCSGWFFFLLPLGAFQIGMKGFKTGFTISYLMQCYHLKGALLALLSVLPQNLILIPALCFYMVYQTKFAADRRHLRSLNNTSPLKRQVYLHNLLMTGIFLALLLLCAFIESFIVPTLLQPVCGLFL